MGRWQAQCKACNDKWSHYGCVRAYSECPEHMVTRRLLNQFCWNTRRPCPGMRTVPYWCCASAGISVRANTPTPQKLGKERARRDTELGKTWFDLGCRSKDDVSNSRGNAGSSAHLISFWLQGDRISNPWRHDNSSPAAAPPSTGSPIRPPYAAVSSAPRPGHFQMLCRAAIVLKKAAMGRDGESAWRVGAESGIFCFAHNT